jgi:diguanylate cyclase (GGDEF)-like protein
MVWPHAALALGLAAVAFGCASAAGLSFWLGELGAWVQPLAVAGGVLLGAAPLNVALYYWARTLKQAALAPAVPVAPARGLARPLFIDLAEREWSRARRYGSGAALVLIDVDRYVRLCEVRGPAAGDAVLAELLRSTAPSLRPADILTRFSESQMAILLAQADATGALDVAERIRERAEQLEVPLDSAHAPTQRLRVTVSAGVAHLRPAHLSLQALVEDAEDAVVAARQAGGNCVRAAPIDPARTRSAGPGRGERRTQPKPNGPV